jgi:hypothetical protein
MGGTVSLDVPLEQSQTTAMLQLQFGPGVDWIIVNANADVYLVIGNFSEGSAPPASTRYRIPSGTCHPVRRTASRVFLAALTGTATSWAYAYPARELASEGALSGPACLP